MSSPLNTGELSDLAARIQAEHKAATTAVRQGCEHAIKAGRLLTEAKNQVPHGQWLRWLQKHCQMSERTAQYYMTLARHFEANPQRVADLAMRQAIKVITAPNRLKHNKQTTNLSLPGPKSDPIPELNSLSWSCASPERRRKFVDASARKLCGKRCQRRQRNGCERPSSQSSTSPITKRCAMRQLFQRTSASGGPPAAATTGSSSR